MATAAIAMLVGDTQMTNLARVVTQFIRTGVEKGSILAEAGKFHPYHSSRIIFSAQGIISIALGHVPKDANEQPIPELRRPTPEGWAERIEEVYALGEEILAPYKDNAGRTHPCGDREPLKLRLPLMCNHGYDGLPGNARVRLVGYVDFIYDPAYKADVEKASADPLLTANAVGEALGFQEPKESFRARGGGYGLLRNGDWSVGGDPWNRLAGMNLEISGIVKKAVYNIGEFIPA